MSGDRAATGHGYGKEERHRAMESGRSADGESGEEGWRGGRQKEQKEDEEEKERELERTRIKRSRKMDERRI